jgi:hypothetical protein
MEVESTLAYYDTDTIMTIVFYYTGGISIGLTLVERIQGPVL